MSGRTMGSLGLSAEEERLYRHFLRHPATGYQGAGPPAGGGQPPDEVRRAVERLSTLGLVYVAGEDEIHPVEPEIAVERLTDLRLRELHEELRQVTGARQLIPELRAEQSTGTTTGGSVERVDDLAQIRMRIDELAFFARDEVQSVEPYGALTVENIESSRALDQRCLRRGVRLRNVVLATALQDPPTAAYLRELVAQGAEIRVTDDISERILIYDRQTALVPVDPSDTSRGALVTREAGLLTNILALFERIWSGATDLRELEAVAAGDTELTPMEQQVLVSMCQVSKDEIGARDLGISVRTYRRHVADILRTLDAYTRAQAALLARERGWV